MSKTFVPNLALSDSPDGLLQAIASGLAHMHSTKDGAAFWKIDREILSKGGPPYFQAICPLRVGWALSGVAPEELRTLPATLTLECTANQFAYNNSTYWVPQLKFKLNDAQVKSPPGTGEYHILASCAIAGEKLVERHLLTRQQLPGFWRLTEGAWHEELIRRPGREEIEALLWRLAPFGFSQTGEDGWRALEIRSWVTGCVKWCGLTAQVELGVPINQVPKALVRRGVKKNELGDKDGAIADYTDAIEFANAPADVVGHALCQRGYLFETHRKDDARAMQDYLAAAERGNSWAQNKVGWWYLTGTELTKNVERAEHYFRLAAAQGNDEATQNLKAYFAVAD
jgi:Sel1 repeat